MERKKQKEEFHREKGNHLKIVQTKSVANSPLVQSIVNIPPSKTDPQGSYTGNPLDENERPVQDADDL